MPPERVRWGVISTANIGRWAVNPAIQASRNGDLVAVASRDGARAQAFAAEHGIPGWYGSYQALLEDPDIDAVYIPLPNSLHREWTIRAAERGKHVLCEKPLAMTAAETEAMGAAAAASGVWLMEAFMYRFHPRTEQVVRLVREGRIGDVRMIRSAFTFRLTRPDNIRLQPELGGGALMDVGCYCVNVSRTVMGAEPVEVHATAGWGATGVDEQLAGTLRFPNGGLAQFDCALTLERREWYEVAGTEGSLGVASAFLPGTDEVVIEEHRGRGAAVRHPVGGADEYRLMVEHFADCVLHHRVPRYPAAEAAANLRVIEALYRSARTGDPVKLS
ncbi:MAG: oxidoreductase domain protein [Gemmatimonadetes bacterium]|nr:oxidoreductase domain protein [Gemmatimonadota bacterium]